ncbi:DDE-type integrase/transposase/recombinase [Cyanobacterium aponinum UTEX 3222]|uniref:DDE domain-containing protein n=2 Tax=Cyanobacterium aponinum TaxID=379064 RepID=K9YZM4_CYAAP|nr:DDE-type integrase/transposase/recombinase [Cyanobacterium aponinum]WRL43887.1 DDE-type integrase/transposase/recombinase [Cyanobacterium aponinum UTEX 3222]AFZ52364.1 hypothetical protein Cyan10605_0208 [Cyanobacterium aponinum PCC 10605]MBD2393743.1 IS6 family transposase [Cyanobacterium aponinum FACHB-4101]PHV61049.1 DDE domain-containing protein [Cyanobacterium aponinum IPPAS B-1201]WPF87626.1 DDE-type integrase/transposase/recombinase [Cyanobacterium aponinum AL20115]
MRRSNVNQWDQIREEVILLCIQWYVTENLTYTQLKKVMGQRGFKIDPRTINYLVKEYSPLAKKRAMETLRKKRRGWRIVQIPFNLRGKKKYLYRALDAQGNTLDFIITNMRNKEKARVFFEQTIPKNLEQRLSKILSNRQILKVEKNNLITGSIFVIILVIIGFIVIKQKDNNQDNNSSNAVYGRGLINNALDIL